MTAEPPISSLASLMARIGRLPTGDDGTPVPFLVAWIDGQPDLGAADEEKRLTCFKDDLCAICGQRLGVFRTFIIAPENAVARMTSFPPSHLDCATWFFADFPHRPSGPFVLWTTRAFSLFLHHAEEGVILLGQPESVSWWLNGHRASRAESDAMVKAVIPELTRYCKDSEDRLRMANQLIATAAYLPPR